MDWHSILSYCLRNYGVPLHLIRELYETFRNFKVRVADYIRYRKITSNMNDRFPDATPEELNAWVVLVSLSLSLNVLSYYYAASRVWFATYAHAEVMWHASFVVRRWQQPRDSIVGICFMCTASGLGLKDNTHALLAGPWLHHLKMGLILLDHRLMLNNKVIFVICYMIILIRPGSSPF